MLEMLELKENFVSMAEQTILLAGFSPDKIQTLPPKGNSANVLYIALYTDSFSLIYMRAEHCRSYNCLASLFVLFCDLGC